MAQPAKKILIVDDEPALLKMMGLYLTRRGYAVTTMPTTDEAWAAAGGHVGDYGAAVLDASMRGLSAEELGSRLLAADASIRVIVASGYPVNMSRLEEAGPGRTEFMQKPFTPEMLAGALRRIFASQEESV
jgi:DNA-binding NtrC family response regulator